MIDEFLNLLQNIPLRIDLQDTWVWNEEGNAM